MTRDDIVRMAREAGGFATNFNGRWMFYMADVERFAALVAAAEREACAQEIESWGPQRYVDDLVAVIRARGQA